ncbi:hypothetical protein COT66_02120 [Candidatus Shapirobacteria bacterium CG09_land_8_20_14_0_10_49_15]|uniref:Cohesin domain-containing protein n=1 Tax=Candidatus Shapirobacteria bacterium CG09_land_8_20_14_0_10_49_15 TaxID=1974482 RepID=A0A2M6XAH2_9BACT|nr:MAG: hypothetical protein COT66_02120 [Candidatus Shapirobacteria bacterium CG09_land_8_20_14_0_10_49_15]
MAIKKAFKYFAIGLGLILPALAAAPVYSQNKPSLSLATTNPQPHVGEIFTVNILLQTGSFEASAVDAVIVFNPQQFEAQEIIPGQLFANYLFHQIDNQKGQAVISAAINPGEPLFKGQGVFGQIVFKPLRSGGPTQISFNFTPGSANGSNVASTLFLRQDLLDRVEGVTIAVTDSWWRSLLNKLLNLFN